MVVRYRSCADLTPSVNRETLKMLFSGPSDICDETGVQRTHYQKISARDPDSRNWVRSIIDASVGPKATSPTVLLPLLVSTRCAVPLLMFGSLARGLSKFIEVREDVL